MIMEESKAHVAVDPAEAMTVAMMGELRERLARGLTEGGAGVDVTALETAEDEWRRLVEEAYELDHDTRGFLLEAASPTTEWIPLFPSQGPSRAQWRKAARQRRKGTKHRGRK